MDFFNGFVKSYWYYFVIGVLSLLLIGTTMYYLGNKEEAAINECDTVAFKEQESSNKIYVDVKGAVKTPGVYEVEDINIINDVIKLAGGFTKKAYTNNINLSKKLVNEMVIYVYTKTEYKSLNKEDNNICSTNTYEIDQCVENGSSVISTNNDSKTEEENINATEDLTSNTEETDTKISINTATKEELMTLDGIGESKANNIINYREKNNGFKSIEEIKNVSGIGEAAYEKIKDYITI